MRRKQLTINDLHKNKRPAQNYFILIDEIASRNHFYFAGTFDAQDV